MRSNQTPIYFHFLVPAFNLPKRTLLKSFMARQAKKEGKAIENINFIFCSDEYLLDLNREHLDHDTLTDIITFELSPKGEPLVSDIYISIDRVRDNANTYGTRFLAELRRVMFHGMLHLCGYKDKSARDTMVMRAKEEEWLERFSKLK
jgi:probable rRNA maturation factor